MMDNSAVERAGSGPFIEAMRHKPDASTATMFILAETREDDHLSNG
jgi:hypothetical protein